MKQLHGFAVIPLVISTVLGAAPAMASVPSEVKCEAGKNLAAGKLAYCLQKAAVKLLKTGGTCSATMGVKCYRDQECPPSETCEKDTTKFDASIGKCEEAFSAQWQKLEAQTQDAGAMCPAQGDEAEVKQFITQCMDELLTAEAGGLLPLAAMDCDQSLATCGALLTICQAQVSACEILADACAATVGICRGGTASAADVRAGQSFSSSSGLNSIGTMPEIGAQQIHPGAAPVAILEGYHDGTGSADGDPDLVPENIVYGTTIFAVTGSAAAARPLKTGQGTCYAGTTVVPCDGSTGQDGELQMGVAHVFEDNDDGTITDHATGLMWEKLANADTLHGYSYSYTWADAFTKIATLNTSAFAGYSDWRLPSSLELSTLANFGQANPAAYAAFDIPFHDPCPSGCTVFDCSCTWSGNYWTSTTVVYAPLRAWTINFGVGGLNSGRQKSELFPVRAVRSHRD